MSDYSYEYDYDDFYCYHDSPVLKNKLNITDKAKFNEAERAITSLRATQALIEGIDGNFDFEHLCRIHKFLFRDIYSWAGLIRTVNISKGNTFCASQFIEQEIQKVFNQLKEENFLKDVSGKKNIACRLSYYISEINAVHPFREGNGRTQRLFITFLARTKGYDINFSNVQPEDMIQASDESFAGHYEKMDSLILNCMVEIQ